MSLFVSYYSDSVQLDTALRPIGGDDHQPVNSGKACREILFGSGVSQRRQLFDVLSNSYELGMRY
jgi:hypothetical protein